MPRAVAYIGNGGGPTWDLGSSSAFSDDAALAQGLAELDEVILPAPAHPPDPGPDVVPARADLFSFFLKFVFLIE